MNKFLYNEAFDSGLFGLPAFWTPFGFSVVGFFVAFLSVFCAVAGYMG
jgi:hypothetical protein